MWQPYVEEKAKKKHEEDPKQKEFKGKQEDADRKRRYAEGCRNMMEYECGVSQVRRCRLTR